MIELIKKYKEIIFYLFFGVCTTIINFFVFWIFSKYFNPEIRDAYKDLEKNACNKLLEMLPPDLQSDYREYIIPDGESEEQKLVKYADRLAAYLKCVEEIKAGNSEFKKAKASIEKELKAAHRPEVECYLKEFAPAFELTLDELD